MRVSLGLTLTGSVDLAALEVLGLVFATVPSFAIGARAVGR